MATKKKKGIPFWAKVLLLVFIIFAGLGAYTAYHFYTIIYKPNVFINKHDDGFFYIPTDATFYDVSLALYTKNYIRDKSGFEWVAERKKYKQMVKPGRYKLTHGMSNNELVDLLRSGVQVPVRITFNNIRKPEQLAGYVAKQLEADSLQIIKKMYSDDFLKEVNLSREQLICLFIPNTYEFFWNTSHEAFLARMKSEYFAFWNNERIARGKQLGMSKAQISTLASIVQMETSRKSEKPIVAGLYINRLKKGMKLQADPSVIFAVGDFTIKRVLKQHLEYDSPYNTYKYAGLPPGPIAMPSIESIDAVLNYQKHDYIFMCAKEDFTGYHNFSTTLAQHNQYAAKYQRALNARKIYK